MSLKDCVSVNQRLSTMSDAYVGKKFTKLSPRICSAAMSAKIGTLISLQASRKPVHILKSKWLVWIISMDLHLRIYLRFAFLILVSFSCIFGEPCLGKTSLCGCQPARIDRLKVSGEQLTVWDPKEAAHVVRQSPPKNRKKSEIPSGDTAELIHTWLETRQGS